MVTVRSQYPNEKTCVLPTRNKDSWKYVSSLYLHACHTLAIQKKHILQTNISNMSSSCLRKTNMIPFGYTSSSKPLTRLKTWMAITIKPYSNHSSVSFIQTQEVMSVFFHNTSHHVYTKSRHWMDSIGICRIQSAASSILVNANLMVWALQTATLKSRHQVKRPMPKAGGFFFWCTNLTQTGLKLIGCTFCFRNLNGAHFSKKV